jgi:DNA-binding transcriptional LysR family regulator
MEMSQIRYTLAASRTLNFTRAAEECNVTQPALTKGIKALEEELGAPLFLREGRRVMLSGFGQSMLPHLRQIVDEAEAARTLAENYRLLDKTPLRLGVLSTIGHMRLAPFLAKLEATHTGLELAVSEGAMPQLREDLDAGRIDAAILTVMPDIGEALRL